MENGQREALKIVEDSLGLMRLLLVALSMQYRSLEEQKKQLLCGKEGEGVIPLQIGGSMMTLMSLLGFFNQSQELNRAGVSDQTDVKLSATVTAASLLRLSRLLRANWEKICPVTLG